MPTPLRITFTELAPSEAIERRVREKLDHLERLSDKIMSCRVVVDRPHRHQHQGGLYSVRVELELAGADSIVATHDKHDAHAHEDVYVAIRDAFAAIERQLHEWTARNRRKTKVHEVPPHGEVVRIFHDDGYGFLRTPDGLEVYFHRNAVSEGEFAELEPGAPVRFSMVEGEGVEGPQASVVTPIGKHKLPDIAATPS